MTYKQISLIIKGHVLVKTCYFDRDGNSFISKLQVSCRVPKLIFSRGKGGGGGTYYKVLALDGVLIRSGALI